MFEFGARIVLAGALVLAAGTTGIVALPLAVGVAVALGILAVAGYEVFARAEGVEEFHSRLLPGLSFSVGRLWMRRQ